MQLDKNHIDDVEHDIRPPMRAAITIPVQGMQGVVVYVAGSPFVGDWDEETLGQIAESLTLGGQS